MKNKPNASYTLKPNKRSPRILSFDPGSRNMGIACVGVRKGKIKVIANAIMEHPLQSLACQYRTNREIFVNEACRWFDAYDPQLLIMERFQTRGHGGPLIELVATMNAVISTIDRSKPCKLVTAATWKNAFNRRFDVDLKELYRECATTPHQLDAVLIGCFGLELAMQTQLEYTPESIIAMAEQTSLLELRRRRC